MTSYIIEVGYNPNKNEDEVWEKLKRVVKYYCDNSKLILDEVLNDEKTGIIKKVKQEELDKYGNAYKDYKDLTISIYDETNSEGEKNRYIIQMASGGGVEREIKEHFRRAFCRLIMKEMHYNCMEINIRVI
jgi:hypothetical protein